jgi:FkbM family methyltransferase
LAARVFPLFKLIRDGIGLVRSTGPVSAAYILARRASRSDTVISVRVRNLSQTLEVNPADSDPIVLSQIFGWREYFPGKRIVDGLRQIASRWIDEGVHPVVLDGGANVGYSAVFFAEMFPGVTILAAEPDKENFERLCRNCAKWPAIKPIHGALWEHGDGVILQKESYGSWGSHVGTTGGLVPSFTLSDLLGRTPNARPLLLKLDIEGAEREVVAASPEVVRSAMCIMVEPHDFLRPGMACMGPLYKALEDAPFDTHIGGENLFFYARELATA